MTLTPSALALAAAVCAALNALAQTTAPSQPAPSNSPQEVWVRDCTARADRNNMTGGARDTFMRECVAGEKFAPPSTGQTNGSAQK